MPIQFKVVCTWLSLHNVHPYEVFTVTDILHLTAILFCHIYIDIL